MDHPINIGEFNQLLTFGFIDHMTMKPALLEPRIGTFKLANVRAEYSASKGRSNIIVDVPLVSADKLSDALIEKLFGNV